MGEGFFGLSKSSTGFQFTSSHILRIQGTTSSLGFRVAGYFDTSCDTYVATRSLQQTCATSSGVDSPQASVKVNPKP